MIFPSGKAEILCDTGISKASTTRPEGKSDREFYQIILWFGIISHHMPLVYSTALRRTNQASGLAQKISQDVFRRLAGKADKLGKEICL